jgi:hypothetical protein
MIPEIRITLRFTFHASRIKRGQVILRHTELTAYRCFLPDLAGFTGFCRTGPSPYLSLEVRSPGGSSRRNYPTPLRFTSHVFIWRRGWAFEVARAETALASTEGASPLVCSPRGGHIPHDPPVRIPPSLFFISPELPRLIPQHSSFCMPFCGGEGGIRTHGPIAGTHAFQACRFDHSRTSPHRFSRGGILTRGLMTGKVTASAHRHGISLPAPLPILQRTQEEVRQ